MQPCNAGPDVMKPLADLDEIRALLADLHATPGVRCLETETAGGVVYKARVRVHSKSSSLPYERHGATLDEALRALHRATAHLRPVR